MQFHPLICCIPPPPPPEKKSPPLLHQFLHTQKDTLSLSLFQSGREWHWHVQRHVDEERHGEYISPSPNPLTRSALLDLLMGAVDASNQALGLHGQCWYVDN